MDQEMIAPELPFEDEQDDPIAAQNLEEFRENEHPIEPPPIPQAHRLLIGPPYETLDLLLQDLNHWAKDNGLGFIKRRVSNYIDSMPTRADLECDRGWNRGSIAHSRKTSTSKTQCPWKAVARARKEDNRLWSIEIKHHEHNHEPSLSLVTHQTHRGLTEAMKALVEVLSKNPSIRPRDIYVTLRQQFPTAIFTQRDIQNCRERLRSKSLAGYTPTQALIQHFEELGIEHVVRYAEDDPNRPIGLFFTFSWCQDMWKRFPWCLQIDNTYKTNRFKMPLFQITGVTNVGSIFNAAFGLVDNEREDGFNWLVSQFDSFRRQLGAPPPDVIITDFDKTLKAAVKSIFPQAAQQICLFHANKNVVLNIKRKWKNPANPTDIRPGDQAVNPPMLQVPGQEPEPGVQALNALARTGEAVDRISAEDVEDSRAGVYLLWKHMIYAKTVDDYNHAWEVLKTKFANQIAILQYLEEYYIPWIEEIASPFISRNRNFGQRTTSPTEASHRDVKSYLVNGNSTLYRLIEVIELMLRNKQAAFEETIATQKVQMRQAVFQQQWLGTTPREVSYKAIDFMIKQKRIALGALSSTQQPNPPALQACTGRFTSQLGLPCSHIIFQRLRDKEFITKQDIHRFWYLERSLEVEYPLLQIIEPKVVTVLKGRPRNSGPFASNGLVPKSVNSCRPNAPSIRRDRSNWETENLEEVEAMSGMADAVPEDVGGKSIKNTHGGGAPSASAPSKLNNKGAQASRASTRARGGISKAKSSGGSTRRSSRLNGRKAVAAPERTER